MSNDFFGGLFCDAAADARPLVAEPPEKPAFLGGLEIVATSPTRPLPAGVVPGVEYGTLFLWAAAFTAFEENHAICQDWSPGFMGELLVLREDEPGSDRGHYVYAAELVHVRDESAGNKKRFIVRFDNVRAIEPIAGVRQPRVGRITF